MPGGKSKTPRGVFAGHGPALQRQGDAFAGHGDAFVGHGGVSARHGPALADQRANYVVQQVDGAGRVAAGVHVPAEAQPVGLGQQAHAFGVDG